VTRERVIDWARAAVVVIAVVVVLARIAAGA
jgi:hypothetical protein